MLTRKGGARARGARSRRWGEGDRGAAPGTDSGGGGRATGKGGGVYPAGATAESCAPVHVVPSFSQNAEVPTELRAATRT